MVEYVEFGCYECRKSIEIRYKWCSGCKNITGWVPYQIWDLGRWNSGFFGWNVVV